MTASPRQPAVGGETSQPGAAGLRADRGQLARRLPVRPRALLIALLLIPVNARWVNEIENIRNSMWPSMFSLPLNVLALLILLTLANQAMKRLAPKQALNQPELLVIYSMLAVASVISGWSFVSRVVGWVAAPIYRATPENQWEVLFLRFLPDWLVPTDRLALERLFLGDVSFWQRANLLAWARPLLFWTLFLLAFMGAMAGVSVIMRRRWIEEERLTFPVVQLPYELTRPERSLLSTRGFWVGFGVSAGIALLGGLGSALPDLPALPKPLFTLGELLPDPPWEAFRGMGNLPVYFYPWVVGFGMLMPTEVLFSYWFFFLLLRTEAVAATALGMPIVGDSPLLRQQVGGAMLAIAPAILWGSRSHLRRVWRDAVSGQEEADSPEPVSYRLALLGTAVCGLIMLTIVCAAGMSVWLALLFLGVYFTMTLSITRARAEIGGPANEVGIMQPDHVFAGALGAGTIGPRSLTALTLFSWTGAAYGQDPIPHQLEALKLAQLGHFSSRRLFLGLGLACVVGTVAAFATLLAPLHRVGVDGAHSGWDGVSQASYYSYSQLQGWLSGAGAAREMGAGGTAFMVAGFCVSLFLFAMRSAFAWWPFHPLGFVMCANYYTYHFWPSLFAAWLLKVLLLRYRGRRGYLAALPFFFGLIAGDAVSGSLWSVAGMVWDIRPFSVWI